MHRCLVLNASYEFLNIADNWLDALWLVMSEKAVPIEHYPEVVRSQYSQWQLPAVVVMRYYVRNKRRTRTFSSPSRRNVFIRDDFQCQYCGAKVTMASGTRDHVHPLSRGGPDTMTNVVTACKPCNADKADRTPEEAGMVLLRRPAQLSDEQKIGCVLKTSKAKERQAWLGCLRRIGVDLH